MNNKFMTVFKKQNSLSSAISHMGLRSRPSSLSRIVLLELLTSFPKTNITTPNSETLPRFVGTTSPNVFQPPLVQYRK
jgi:hypothetical protein